MTRPGPDALRARLAVYAVTPTELTDDVLAARVLAALRGGVSLLQVRDKRPNAHDRRQRAARLLAICRAHGAWCILNDDVALAAELGADGVHLGPSDMPIAAARALVGPSMLLGGSAGTPERALELARAGADYLGVGAIFDAHHTKPDASAPRGTEVLGAIRAVPGLATFPLVAIGGVDAHTAAACVAAGADGVAVVRALFDTDDPEHAATDLCARVANAQRALA